MISAASQHGYSRAAFYLVADAFEEEGMQGLLDEKRGRRGPLKVTPEINAYVRSPAGAPRSGDHRRAAVNVERKTL